MIEVSLTTLIYLGLIVGVGLLAIIWAASVIQQRRHEFRIRQDLVHCRICGLIFQNTTRQEMAACPSCGSLNEATRPKPI